MTKLTTYVPGPYLAHDGASKHDNEPDNEMANWMSHVVATMPFREHRESDRPGELIEHQTVCIAKGRTSDEAIANAWLFAAAPKLLETLEHIIETADGGWHAADKRNRRDHPNGSPNSVERDVFAAIARLARAGIAEAIWPGRK
jgi:hypothetical protein